MGERFGIVLLGVFLLAAGCAGPKKVASVPSGMSEKEVAIEASSFGFDPEVIRAREGQHLVLVVENVSGSEHNMTVKNPSGKILLSRDLPPHQSVRLELSLPEKGTYPFYCDKPLHPLLGMKGSVLAE